ncbi:MAG TPA: xanthine dehydrogenase family protein molybdopterin-binding subunit [Pseudonocardia sp.]|uniref:xanthine dehydrogenase family protein molybdopterin-binding subunit n=1 Tax=Pseudonocardia sp. TaxID=60912 RepID=UPI002F417A33
MAAREFAVAPQAPAIGQPMTRAEGILKVTGRAGYAADHTAADPELPGLVHAVLVLSAASRAESSTADLPGAATAAPGVLDVLTDFTGATLPFPTGQVNFFGQPVAIVVADTLERAEHAASLIDTAALNATTAVTDLDDPAAAPHPAPKTPDYRRGDPDGALRSAHTVIDQRYRIARNNHNPMELPATVARWDGDRLTVFDKTQWVQGTARSLAAALGVPVDNVRVLSPFVGGAFGSAGNTWPHQVLAAFTARKLNRPVKLVLNRRQMYSGIGYRPTSDQRLAVAADPDGRLTAVVQDARTENARYASYEDDITDLPKVLYQSPAMSARYRLVPLDVHLPTYMRGPGAVSGAFAMESAMDELAVALNLDPIELRLRNEPTANQAKGLPFSTRGLPACYRKGAAEFGWSARNPVPRARVENGQLIGLGMAAAGYHTGRAPASANARIDADGTAVISSATSDMGPGTYTSMAQVAADTLGLPVGRVRFVLGDSALPKAPIHAGSLTMASVGSAVLTACATLRDGMVRTAVVDPVSPLHGAAPETVTVRGGLLSVGGDTARAETYQQILRRRGRTSMDTLRDWSPGDASTRSSTYGYGAVFAEVSVDELLGTVRIRRLRATYDVGTVVNPRLAHSQAIGGMVYGIGMTLLEATVRDRRDGRIMNANMSDYLVPTNADVPDLDATFLDLPDPATGPIGVKGLGELVIVGVPAAIANAVYNATGRRVRDLPITLDTQL